METMKLRCRLGWHKWSIWEQRAVKWVDAGYTGWTEEKYCVLCEKIRQGGYG